MLKDFYVAFATVCFTLLGLWFTVGRARPARPANTGQVEAAFGHPCRLGV